MACVVCSLSVLRVTINLLSICHQKSPAQHCFADILRPKKVSRFSATIGGGREAFGAPAPAPRSCSPKIKRWTSRQGLARRFFVPGPRRGISNVHGRRFSFLQKDMVILLPRARIITRVPANDSAITCMAAGLFWRSPLLRHL